MADSIELKDERKNPLFGRREITAQMRVEGATPTRKHVKKLLADKLASAEECIVLEKIEHRYGTRAATIYASVYDSAELAKKEPGYKSERGGGKKQGGDSKEEKTEEKKQPKG
ncbi:MAG: hypothetical protein V1787_03725 [Candidatus Micrarchaeota archaeon]